MLTHEAHVLDMNGTNKSIVKSTLKQAVEVVAEIILLVKPRENDSVAITIIKTSI